MSWQSSIDPSVPAARYPTTASVRANFATAKAEIEQNRAAADATQTQLDALAAAIAEAPAGPQGPKGDKGDTGDTGPTGATGPAGSGASLDLAAYLKQCGPTHESNWVGDYTIGAVLRPLASGELRGVRLWWPMGVSCNATITVYRSGASPVAAVSRSFTPGEVATAFFDVPLDVVAGEYLMVCVYGGGVGHPHSIVTAYLPTTTPLILGGFVMQGYTWFVAGNAKPNTEIPDPYRPLFWPVF